MDDESSLTSNTINISEKLENSINAEIIPEVPEDIIYPNELNNFLREQLRFYVQKNGLLQQNLSDLEVQYSKSKENLEKLVEKLNKYEKMCDTTKFATSSQMATSKIIELSKKLREKNSEMEALRTKCSKMEKYAFVLKQQLESEQPADKTGESVHQDPSSNIVADEEIKKLNEKLTVLNNKLAESNNLNLQLKNEIKLAKKILQQETGDTFENFQNLNNLNGWRGRAQTILDLQQKNAELKEKLKSAQTNNPMEVMPTAPSKSETQLIAMTKDNEELKAKLEDIRKKHDILKARHRVIDIDYNLLKSKSEMLKEQAARDQQIITTLLGQLNSSKELKNDLVSQKERFITKLQGEKKLLNQEIEEYKSLIKKLQEKQKEEDDKMYPQPVEDIKKKSDNVNEIDKKLLEFIEQANQKLKAEREAHAKTQNLLRLEKQKVVKTEAALSRVELEITSRSTYSSTGTLRALDLNLKDQLELAEEQIKALQTRLEIEQMERRKDIQQFGQILKSYEAKLTNLE